MHIKPIIFAIMHCIFVTNCYGTDFNTGMDFFERGQFKEAKKNMKKLLGDPEDNSKIDICSVMCAMESKKKLVSINNELKIDIILKYFSDLSIDKRKFYDSFLARLFLEGILTEPHPNMGVALLELHADRYGYAAYLLGQYYEGKIGPIHRPLLISAKYFYLKSSNAGFYLADKKIANINAKLISGVKKYGTEVFKNGSINFDDIYRKQLQDYIADQYFRLIKKPQSEKKAEGLLKKQSILGNEFALGFLMLYITESKNTKYQKEAEIFFTLKVQKTFLSMYKKEPENPYLNFIIGKFLQLKLIDCDDENNVLFYLEKAIKKNYIPALFALVEYKSKKFKNCPDDINLKILKKISLDDYPQAQYALAYVYEKYFSNKKYESIILYKKAALLGYPDAQFRLAKMYLYSDEKKSILLFKKAADAGHLDSQYYVASLFDSIDTSEHKKLALYYYKKAAQVNHINSLYRLGELLIEKQHMKDVAIEYLKRAAEFGFPPAQYKLAMLYICSPYLQKDIVRAEFFLQKASNFGLSRAIKQLNILRARPQYAYKNISLISELAVWGCLKSQFELGWRYTRGSGVIQSDLKAFEWFSRAAEHGYRSAQYQVGWRYTRGSGVVQSDLKAFEWFSRAAEQGHRSAQYQVGWKYLIGSGVVQSDLKSFEWFSRAAEQGHRSAQYQVGWKYLIGSGVVQSDLKAFEWFSRAAEQRHRSALYLAGSLFLQNKGEFKNSTVCSSRIYEEARKGNNQFCRLQANMYFYGYGKKRDQNKALYWYKKAALKGDTIAQIKLGDLYSEKNITQHNKSQALYWYYKALYSGTLVSQNCLPHLYSGRKCPDQNITMAKLWEETFIINLKKTGLINFWKYLKKRM